MTDVVVSGQGQSDNIGDSVLRRGLLDALRPNGRLVVNVAGLSEDYLSGLGLRELDRTIAERAEWQREILAASTRGCLFAFNSGEAQLNRSYGLTYSRLLPLLLLNRARGGSAVHLGFGLRSESRTWARVMRADLRVCSLVTWRDECSRRWVGLGEVQPDWAYWFAPPTPPTDDERRRDVLALSLRFDRPEPGAVWLDVVSAVARERGLRVVAVPQVERDIPRARLLGAALGGDLLDWDGTDHSANEARVRSVYRRSALVVSDRLHALVMGHTEGAVPVGFGVGPVGKLTRTLGAVGLEGVTFREADVDVTTGVARVDAALERSADIVACASEARRRLDTVAARVGDLLRRPE